MIDQVKHRREFGRWVILLTLYNAKPIGLYEEVIVSVLQAMWPDATPREVRVHLDYLCDRQLVDLRKEPSGRWFADLARFGVDVVEYTVDVDPGIARPAKYS